MTRLLNCTAKAMAIAAFLSLVSCDSAPTNEMTSEDKLARIEEMIDQYQQQFPDVPGIDAAALRDDLARDAVVLVDVRTEDERTTSMIAGAISREEFELRSAEFEGSAIVTYCTIGYRSGDYAQKLRQEGWDARNFDGSILAWTHAGEELVDAEGNPTRRVHVFGERWNLAAEGYEPVW